MTRTLLVLGLACLATGCQSVASRIARHADAFNALDPETQARLRAGEPVVGDSRDMVYVALGTPARKSPLSAAGEETWVYSFAPPEHPEETIRHGYRRRTLFDPARRADMPVVEWIDTKAFPNLVPYDLRITFRHGRVTGIERIER